MSSARPSIGDVVFTAVKPIVKMAVVALGGALMAKKGVLSPEACKADAAVVVNLLLPFLIFNTVVTSFDTDNIGAAVCLLLTGAFYQILGLTFGLIVRWTTPVPRTWRGGVLAAGALCNWGDLIIAYIGTLANSAPFNGESDITKGTAYSSIFMVTQILALFNLGGLVLIKRDFTAPPPADIEKSSKTAALPSKAAVIATTRKTVERVVTTIRRRRSTNAQCAPQGLVAGLYRAQSAAEAESSARDRIQAVELSGYPTLAVPEGHEDAIEDGPDSGFPNSMATSVAPSLKEAPLTRALEELEQPAQPRKQPKSLGRRVLLWFKAFLRPPSLALILSLIIALVNPIKALFVASNKVDIPDAPDGYPPLDFIMDITSFGGQAVPVLGMILLGAALSRLTIKGLPKGFWKTMSAMAVLKLVVGPIIGIVWTTQIINRTGLMDDDDKILKFVMIISAGVPTATTQVYLSSMFAPTGPESQVAMSSLSAILLAQYAFMVLSLTVLVSYTLLKVL